jgi:hypothetical protein
MPRLRLSDTLFQIHDITPVCWELSPTTGATEVATFIAKGHVMEFIDLGLPNKKIVSLFFGPNEFVVRCHPFSKLVALDDMTIQTFTHGNVVDLLRKFPETHHHYRSIRKIYQEKVAARQASLTLMSERERFEDMLQKQPWILELAKLKDIADYLNISETRMHNLLNLSPQN